MPNPNAMDVKLNGRLEVLLKKYCEQDDVRQKFPSFGGDYFIAYCTIKQNLWKKYYRDVPAGLNTTEALRRKTDIAYTHHDVSHVDDVIDRMASLLGLEPDAETLAVSQLSEYSLFVVLVACLVHDAGNRDGREGHSNRAVEILNDVGKNTLTIHEIQLIAKIADAHGGYTRTGEMDTIGPLGDRGGVDRFTVNPQRLAALLRFADELADNPRRGSSRRAETSQFANLYCERINTNIDHKSERISIEFVVYADEVLKPIKDENDTEKFFLDYIYDRLQKTEIERRYCTKFMRNFISYNSIRVLINFYSEHEIGDHKETHLPLEYIAFEMADHGFPFDDGNILPKEALSGAEVARMFTERTASSVDLSHVEKAQKGVAGWIMKILSKFTNPKN